MEKMTERAHLWLIVFPRENTELFPSLSIFCNCFVLDRKISKRCHIENCVLEFFMRHDSPLGYQDWFDEVGT